MNLLGAARTTDEEHDAEDFATLIHGEDGCHPWTNPFKMFGRLDDPDEYDFASGNSAVGVTGNEIAHVWDLVCDSYTTGEKHDGTVGMHHVHTTVRTFGECAGDESAFWGGFGFGDEGLGETGAGANDVGHAGLAHGEDILSTHWELFVVEDFGFR